MPTSVPAVVAFGDVQQVVLVSHQSTILSVCLRAGSLISIHRDGDNPEIFTNLPAGGSKDKLAAAVKGNLLHLAWGSGSQILHARWDLLTDTFEKAPTAAFAGSRPAMAFGQSETKLLVHYVSNTGTHESRVSLDDGDTWATPASVDAETTIINVDVSVSPADDNFAAWTNTKPALFPAPLAYWSMDSSDLSGATLTSHGTTSLNATLVGNAALVAGGQVNEQVDLDGSGDYLTVPSFTIGGAFSMSAWVTWDTFALWSRIIDFGVGQANSNLVVSNQGTSNTLYFDVYEGGAAPISAAVLSTGVRYHVVATVDGAGNGVLYLNNSVVASGAMNIPANVARGSNFIGRSNWPDADFNGRIDELAIWNVALSAPEVAALNQRGLDGERILG